MGDPPWKVELLPPKIRAMMIGIWEFGWNLDGIWDMLSMKKWTVTNMAACNYPNIISLNK